MLNPSDLEGEVDHSFFDSGCDDSSLIRHESKKKETCLKVEKESPPEHEELHAKENEVTSGGLSLKTDGPQNQLKPVENNKNSSSPERKHNNCPSPTSMEPSVDADSESSCDGRNGRSSLDSPTFPRSSSSPVMTNIRVGSAGSRGVSANQAKESNDTVADVSPLSSPDYSPLQSLNLNHTEAEEQSLKEQPQESVPSSGPRNVHQDKNLDHDDDDCSLSFERLFGTSLAIYCPGGRKDRKNYSFSNDEVRTIDYENQRLCRELVRISQGHRPPRIPGKKTCAASNSFLQVSHSALNRQLDQKRIERENLAFLKRVESAKPTPGLKRSEQLADYKRQAGYPGAPLHPICVSTTRKVISTGKAPLGLRLASSTHHSTKAGSTTTDSTQAPVPRSKKPSAIRPPWC